MVDITEERTRLADVGLKHRLRSQWGALRAYTDDRAVTTPATRLFLHITITNPENYVSNDAHARGVEAIGIARFPNTGVSYNELILPGGLLYEAQPLGRRGAHTVNTKKLAGCTTTGCPGKGTSLAAPDMNLNVNARAISLARNVQHSVTDADVDAAAQWGAATKLAGFVTRDARWHGHRCVAFKSCPGDRGFTRLDDIADLTATYVRDGLPGTTPPDEPQEPDMATPEERQDLAERIAKELLTRNVQSGSESIDFGLATGRTTAHARDIEDLLREHRDLLVEIRDLLTEPTEPPTP